MSANPLDFSDPEPSPPSRNKRPESGGPTLKWFYIFVGVAVLVAAGIFIYDRAETYYSRKRLETIDEKINRGLDDQWLRDERQEILRRHPEFKRD